MPNQAPNFALPGLMEITRPALDDQRQLIRLPTKRSQDSHWAGIPSVGPVMPGGVTPTFPLVLVLMKIGRQFPVGDDPVFVFSSAPSAGEGIVTIDNPTTWLFHLPLQPLSLPIGNYSWELHTTDASGVVTVYYTGNLLIAA